ncbi:MAG: hypothetical protein SGJ19_07720 [Planctomycetia bacterium]|nr:hypothetical protein [Planctomycetia bacterium]
MWAIVLVTVTNGQAAEPSRTSYRERLETLATDCANEGLTDEAAAIRAWAAPRDSQCFYPVLPEALVPLNASAGDENSWPVRFAKLRSERADELYEQAKQAVGAGRSGEAYQTLWNTLRENPDHALARKSLGYTLIEGAWRTRFEAEKHRAGQIWHAEFGWLPQEHVARYEAGERYYLKGWISAEKEAELRSELARGWLVQTEHYSIRTNHSLEAGVKLATRLERLHAVWRQLFVTYYASPRQIAEAFVRKPLAAPARRLQVVYYRDRAEYLSELRAHAAQIEITTGFYLGEKETAYFFAAEEEDVATQYHEATHQLFGESRPIARGVGADGNFWIIEGIACYMESLRERDGRWITGGLDTVRLLAARQRYTDDQFYLPLADLTALGMSELQQNPKIRSIYSQSTAMTHFLLHGLDGKYREAAMQYILAVYTGRDRATTLSELTETEYADLDRQYEAFIQQVPLPGE